MRCVLVALLVACTHSKTVEREREAEVVMTDRDVERTSTASTTEKTVKVGPTDTVTVKATLEAPDGGLAPDEPVEVVVTPQADGGVSVRVRPPKGTHVADVQVAETRAGPVETHEEGKASGQTIKVDEGKVVGREKEKDKTVTKDKVGLSFTTKVAIWVALALLLLVGLFLLRRAKRAAVAAIPFVGPILAILMPKEQTP